MHVFRECSRARERGFSGFAARLAEGRRVAGAGGSAGRVDGSSGPAVVCLVTRPRHARLGGAAGRPTGCCREEADGACQLTLQRTGLAKDYYAEPVGHQEGAVSIRHHQPACGQAEAVGGCAAWSAIEYQTWRVGG